VTRWNLDDTLDIYRARSHGENYTDPTLYDCGNGDVLAATPNGWSLE